MPKIGDVVFYTTGGKTYNALVLSVRLGEVSHHGKNDEPLLTITYVDADRDSARTKSRPDYFPTVAVEHDVVHASHEFSADYKRDKGIQTPAHVANHRGPGEWEEAIVMKTQVLYYDDSKLEASTPLSDRLVSSDDLASLDPEEPTTDV